MKKKIYISLMLLLIVGILTTGMISMSYVRQYYNDQLEEQLTQSSNLIHKYLLRSDVIEYDAISEEVSQLIDARVTIINSSGVVIGDSDANIELLDNHLYRTEISEAFKTNKVSKEIRYSNTLKKDLYYIAVPVMLENGKHVIRLSVSLDDIERFNNKLLLNYLIALIVGIIIANILAVRFVKYIRQPIKELSLLTEKISKGDFGEKIYLDYDEEIQLLSKNFNRMSTTLKNKIDEIEYVSSQMQAILQNIKAGIIVINANKKIVFLNSEASKILDVDEGELSEKLLIQGIRDIDLYDLISDMISERYDDTKISDVGIDDKHYSVLATPIINNTDDQYSIVIVMQDTTEQKQLENMRKEFVANVSHELKTPLTSIQGFIDTLQRGAIDDFEVRDKFLNIVNIESRRLTTLVEDLLLLSDVERTVVHEDIEFDVTRVIDEVVEMMKTIGDESGINIIKGDISLTDANLIGNPAWFKQVLINLVDNGIKYNNAPGNVTITANNHKGQLIIEISDDGIGISELDKNRIYERFFRVDKSHSKEVGGTGLGLAIVKHIMRNYNAQIDVESELNIGTTFKLIIPNN